MAQITLNSTGVASSGALTLQSNGTTNAVTVDTSQNVGIGTTTPQGPLDVTASGATVNQFLTGGAGNNSVTGIFRIGSGSGRGASIQGFRGASSNIHSLDFYTYNSADVFGMRLDSSGNLLIGATSSVAGGALGVQWSKDSNGGYGYIRANLTTTYGHLTFYNPNGQVGQISTNGSATTYATSSDYRLKNTIAPMTGALAKVAALKPVTYKWNVDGSDGEGFIAHELAEVVPQCVTGNKDAVDADGNPKYQGIDTSFLVATLTAAIQEQQVLITQLTARITALEGA